jgi:hypothetical protein
VVARVVTLRMHGAAAGAAALCLVLARAGAATPYLGAAGCASCHADVQASWRRTAHARATASLSRAEAARPICRGCHATGEAPAGRSDLPGVQCEACHGPGADYAPDDVMRDPGLARLLGLRDLSTPQARAPVCMRCHVQGTRTTPFDPEAAWQRIRHDVAREGG